MNARSRRRSFLRRPKPSRWRCRPRSDRNRHNETGKGRLCPAFFFAAVRPRRLVLLNSSCSVREHERCGGAYFDRILKLAAPAGHALDGITPRARKALDLYIIKIRVAAVTKPRVFN